jgi:SAM-dependent methyltransferase
MKTLNEIYQRYSSKDGHGDKGTVHTYIDEYEKLLKDYRNDVTFLEIGLFHGESIQMWSEYFNNSKIYGIDINDRFVKHLMNDERFNIIISDATDQNLINRFPKDIKFDVVIDDGSHKINDQVKTFNLLKDHMNPGGIYIIEDIDNIDATKKTLTSLHDNCQVIDNRQIKKRWDDVLIVYKF